MINSCLIRMRKCNDLHSSKGETKLKLMSREITIRSHCCEQNCNRIPDYFEHAANCVCEMYEANLMIQSLVRVEPDFTATCLLYAYTSHYWRPLDRCKKELEITGEDRLLIRIIADTDITTSVPVKHFHRRCLWLFQTMPRTLLVK